jgi:hypothetical protein
MSDYYPERDYVQEASDHLEAKDRAEDFEGCDGCSAGDCPHTNVNDCVSAQGKTIAEQESELATLRAENAKLREALTFYADADTYEQVDVLGICPFSGDLEHDREAVIGYGKRARAAHSPAKPTEEK